MKTIELTYHIDAPVSEVWKALTDAKMAEQWGAAPAEVEAVEGGGFSYWDGDIHGVYTKLVEDELIEQDWYGHDNPEKKFRAIFDFEVDGKATIVHLTFSGEIEDEDKDVKDWNEFYFEPIRELLER